ncbi:Uncharacterised protein [Mycobacteroides abscessus subsp. abscessus]|nr:Uncharacterised protein [Mycobacteroides abscessus subsp. abscessus]
MLLGDLRDRLPLLGRRFRGDRVLQIVVDDRHGRLVDRVPQPVEVDGEPVLGRHVPVGQAPAAEVFDLGFVDREPGVGVEHGLAGVHDGLEELRDHGLAAGRDDHLGGVDVDAAARPDVLGERCPQFGDPRTRAVPGLPVRDRPVHRLDDVRGHRKVEVAEVERIDPVPLRPPVRGRLRDTERGLRAQVGQSLGSLHRRLLRVPPAPAPRWWCSWQEEALRRAERRPTSHDNRRRQGRLSSPGRLTR